MGKTGKTGWQATRRNQIKVLKTLFMPSCLWVEARDESKHDLKTAYVSPKAQVHYVQGRVVQRGRQREGEVEREGENRGSWHKASSLCC